MNEFVPVSAFPKFFDEESIHFLLKITEKDLELEKCVCPRLKQDLYFSVCLEHCCPHTRLHHEGGLSGCALLLLCVFSRLCYMMKNICFFSGIDVCSYSLSSHYVKLWRYVHKANFESSTIGYSELLDGKVSWLPRKYTTVRCVLPLY